ncbi:MAG: CBS domain-containing protein [Candidatus Omnitrophota bacterium]
MDLIVTHTGGDFDSLASLVAAKKLYPDARLLFPGSQEKNVREFISLCKNLVKIETEKDIIWENVTRLIIVDTRLKNRIGGASELIGKPGIKVHIFDHHPETQQDIKGDLEIYRKTGATVTILLDLIKKKKIKITPIEATIMALGIYEDTGSLTFRTTTREDVDAVSFLMSAGADLAVVSSYLTRELSDDEISVLVKLIQATESHLINGIKIAISTIEADHYLGDLSALIHKLIDIESFNVFFIMAKIENKIHIVARSRLEAVNVDKIMRKFGGGGHSTAASAVVKEFSLTAAKESLIGYLKKEIKPTLTAKDIMSSPVKTVTPEHIIDDVRKTMIRYKIGGMPVLTKGKLTGIITRSDVDKAIYHDFGHSRVKGYMSTNLITARSNTPIYELQRIIFEENIGRVPIVLKGKLTGIVSRTDLLRTVHEELMTSLKKHEVKEKRNEKILFEENIAHILKTRLPAEVFEILILISEEAYKNKTRVYLVGGVVRDLLLNVRNYDIDIVVEGSGIEFAGILSNKLGGKVVAHTRFKTAILFTTWPGNNIKDKVLRIDIATARTEYYEFPAALPRVELSTLKNDLYRRDFTINAMAVSLNKDNFGTLIDFFGGRKDLLAGKIKVLHNLSFVEDPTRIFRAVRFEQRYDFKIDSHAEHLIKTAVSMDMIGKVAGERLREEIVYILNEEEPLKGIKRMAGLHELRFIHPKIKWSALLEKNLKETKRAIEWFNKRIGKKIDIWLVYFMVMLGGLTNKELLLVVRKFMLSNSHKQKILSVKKNLNKAVNMLKVPGLKPSRVYEILRGKSFEEIILIVSRAGASTVLTKSFALVKKRVEDYVKIYSEVKPCIGGGDLEKMGVTPSPKLGKILNALREAKLNGLLKTREDEMNFCERIIEKAKK